MLPKSPALADRWCKFCLRILPEHKKRCVLLQGCLIRESIRKAYEAGKTSNKGK